jgi:hypothetical protein
MRTTRTLLGGLVLAGSAVLAVPGTAHACSCVSAGPRQYVEWADAVVWARVVDVQRPAPPIGDAHYLLEVDRVYKGEVTRSAQVDSDVSGAACGLEGIESDRSYAFFLEGTGSPWSATLCGGTGAVDRDRLEQVLGAGEGTDEGTGGQSGTDARAGTAAGVAPQPGGPTRLPVSTWSWAGVGAGALACLVGCAAWALRHRRPVG